jgi:hypothetical protein
MVEAASDQIGIAIEVAENPCAIAPGTGMVGSDIFRVFLEHPEPHGDVMQIA